MDILHPSAWMDPECGSVVLTKADWLRPRVACVIATLFRSNFGASISVNSNNIYTPCYTYCGVLYVIPHTMALCSPA